MSFKLSQAVPSKSKLQSAEFEVSTQHVPQSSRLSQCWVFKATFAFQILVTMCPTSGTNALIHYRLIQKKLPTKLRTCPASIYCLIQFMRIWNGELCRQMSHGYDQTHSSSYATWTPSPPQKREDLWPGFNHMVSGQLLSFLISRWSSLSIFSDHLPNVAVGFPQGEMSQEGAFKMKSSGFNNFIWKVIILPGIFCLWRAWM